MGAEPVGTNALGDFLSHGGLTGASALALALGLIYVSRRLLHGKGFTSNERLDETRVGHPIDSAIAQDFNDDRLAQWNEEQDRIALTEAVSSLAWGLPIFGFLSGALTFVSAIHEQLRSAMFGLSWIAILVVFIFLFLATLRQKTFKATITFGSYAAAVSLLWPGLLLLLAPDLNAQALTLLGVIYFAYGSLPISGRNFMIISLVACLILVPALLQLSSWLFIGVFAILLMVITTRSAVAAYIDLCWRISSAQLARFGEGIRPGIVLRLLARQLQYVLDAPNVLLVSESGAGVLSYAEHDVGRVIDPVAVRALLGRLDEIGMDDGKIRLRDLGDQYLGLLLDWFGHLPRLVHYVRILAIIGDREERVLFLAPPAFGLGIVSESRLTSAIGSITGMARAILAIGRHRILSSDVFVSSAKSVSERELELDKLIHSVNNSSQDIAIQCDEIRQNLDKVVVKADERSAIESALKGLKQLETLSRTVSAGVSDVKLMRELQKLREISRSEQVKLLSVIEELETFSQFRSWRKGFDAAVSHTGCDGFAVKVAGREFLEMCLRLVVKSLGARLESKGRLNIHLECDGKLVKIICSDTGAELGAAVQSRVLDTSTVETVGIAEVDALRAVNKFVNLSGGTLAFGEPEAGFNNCMSLVFSVVPATEVRAPVSGQWVLLVDDSLEVTTFYGRVAEALQLKYFTATSLAGAQQILSEEGRPRLVITDVQLGDGSGIDLVRALRSKYGAALPVIVVSGESDSEVVERIKSAGATKYLTKPVGRKKLFEEIELVMGAVLP